MSDTLPDPPAAPQDADPGSDCSSDPGATPAPADALMTEAAERIRALEAESQDFRDRWMRAEADMQNLRNRTRREVDEAKAYAVQKFAKDVVEAAENIRRGIDSLPKPQPNEPEIVTRLREGFDGVERSFVGVLERNGIVADDPLHKQFDANLHQAMGEQSSDQHPPGTILQVWSRAWTLNGRLLRPAMVVVAKSNAQAAPAASVNTTA